MVFYPTGGILAVMLCHPGTDYPMKPGCVDQIFHGCVEEMIVSYRPIGHLVFVRLLLKSGYTVLSYLMTQWFSSS